MVESVVSLATMCQFLGMMAESCLPMSAKGVIMRRIDDTSFRAEWMMRMEEK